MIQADVTGRNRALFHPGLVSSGATLLIAAFVTDILYWQSTLFQWNNFSAWLLVAGLVIAALAAIALGIDLLLRRIPRLPWLRLAGLTIAALLSVLNAFVHSRDAYTAVVPEGILLSGIVTLLLLAVGLSGGWALVASATVTHQQSRMARQ